VGHPAAFTIVSSFEITATVPTGATTVLVGLLKFHSVSLCGGLYPLPCRPTFRIRDALHLIETRNGVTHVSGVFQRLLALFRESELGCGYPIANWLR
jgi:hypothetical protein